MKSKIFLFYLSLLLVLSTGCGEKIESTWKNQELTVDGNGQDWEGFPLQYHEDMKIVYGIVNDDATVNFMIRFNDESLARMFSMRGFTLWLNEEDEEQKQIGIHYRDDSMRHRFMAERRDRYRERDQDEQISSELPKPKGKFTLAKNDSLTIIPLRDIAAFEAAADSKDGIFCYEFSIPLTSAEGSPYYLNISNQKIIKVGLEIVGMSEEEKENLKAEMEERQKSMQGGDMGGRSRGGMKGGMRGGGKRGGGNRPQMPDMDGEEYWITVQLAVK